MRRALEFEIRLSYYERIAKTLPEPMQPADAYTLPEQAPSPNFEYDDAGSSFFAAMVYLTHLNAFFALLQQVPITRPPNLS